MDEYRYAILATRTLLDPYYDVTRTRTGTRTDGYTRDSWVTTQRHLYTPIELYFLNIQIFRTLSLTLY